MARLLECPDRTHTLAWVAYGDRPHCPNLIFRSDTDYRARAILSAMNGKWSYEREWRLFAARRGESLYVGWGARQRSISEFAWRPRRDVW